MKLFQVHCGFYDLTLCDGQYEAHVNFFVAAEDFESAKLAAKALPEFQIRKMHIDGLVEFEAVGGHRLMLEKDETLEGKTLLRGNRFRELAPKPLK